MTSQTRPGCQDNLKVATSEDASFETNFFMIASTSEAETSVSAQAEWLLAMGKDRKSKLFGVTLSFKLKYAELCDLFLKGADHLTVTWKVDEGVYQHVDVREEGKENAFSLGRSLWIDSEVRNGTKPASKELKNICSYLRMFLHTEKTNIVETGRT